MPGPRPILGLASELDLPPRPSADELLVATQACRALRVRLVKEHVRVSEAIEQLQAGFDEAFDDEGAALDNRGAADANGDDDEDEDDGHDEDIERQRRHTVAESLVAAGGDPDRLKRKEFLALCELEVVRAVLIPAFVAHGGSEAAAETIEQGGTGGFFIEVMKLLAALTMPVPPGSDAIARQRDCLRRVRSGIASDDVVSFVVSTVAPVASSRLEGPLPRPAAATIEVTLTLFNNVLKAPARECELVVGAMCRAHGIDLLLVILRQNHAKVEQALREAYNETGDEGEREVLRGLIGDGYAGTMAAHATSALAASLRGDDPRSSSRALDSDIDGLFNHGDSRAPRHSASRGSGESRIPFPMSPARPPSMQAPGSSAQRPSSSAVPGTPNRGTSSHGGTPRSAEPDAADPVSRALLGTPRKSPKRPTVHHEMRKPASPMHRPVSSQQQRSQDVPPPIPSTLPPIAAASTYLNVETQLAAGVLGDTQAPPPLSVADWVSSVSTVRDPASVDIGSSAIMSVVVPSPAPYTPAGSAVFGAGGSMAREDDIDTNNAETPAPVPPIPLASEHVDLSPPEIEVLGVDDAPATPASEEAALFDGNATSKALMSATPSRKSNVSSSSPKQASERQPDSEDDDAALLGERRAESSAEATGCDEEDGLEAYAKQGGGPQDSEEDDEDEEDEGNDDDDDALYDQYGNLILRERDMKRDRVLAKLYADEKKRARGESMSALRRWNLVILEACALVFRSAPSATLATLGFGAEVSGSATTAAKKAIAMRLSSQKVEMARWKDAVRRRQGATNSTALLVQRSDGPGSRLNAVGEANRTLQAKSELETAQELDARKRRIFRKKLLQANADDGSTSMLPLQTQVSLAGHYRQFAQFGFANLSSMLWPELQGRISSITEGLVANRDAAQAIKDNNEGPMHNALDEIQIGDVLNYCALATTMLRFGRVTLRLRQATITGEARDMMLGGGGGGAETQQREDAAVSLVDQALLPIATEVLTTSRLANAVTMLDVLQTNTSLQKKHDYLIALGYVGELLRVLVHSVDGELADSEPVRLAATSLASTLAFDPSCMRTVLASTSLVLHASASIRQIETTLRAIHAAMLLLDRVSFGGKVQQEVRNKRGGGRSDGADGGDSDDDGEGMVAPTMLDETLPTQEAETLPDPDDDTQLPAPAREATPPRQVIESGLAVDEDTTNDAAIASTDGAAAEDGGSDDNQQRIGNVVVDADGNATIAPTGAGESAQKGKKSKKPKAEPKTEKSVEVTSFFQQLVTPKRLAVFLHALRLWRQLADDVIEALVFFLEAFRHDEVRAEPVFFSMFAIIPFNDILHARDEAPPALFNVAMAYMRDFWGQVSTTYEMEMRCVRTLLPLDQGVHWQAVSDTRDPVLRELVEGAVDSMTRHYRTEGAVADAANHELMGYTTYDDDGNPIERTFDEEEPDQRKPKRRRARTRAQGDGTAEAPHESVIVPDFDEVEAMNAAVVMATQTLGEEADPDAIFTQAEDIVARERAAHDARLAEAAKGKARKPRAKRAPAAKKSTPAEPKPKKSEASKPMSKNKKKHRTEGDAGDEDDDLLLGLAGEGVMVAAANEAKSENKKIWLNDDGSKKPKSQLSKAERKAYKKYKKAKKEKKAAKLSAKAAKRKQRAEAGLTDTAMTQELFSATQMATYTNDGGDSSSSAASSDDDDALLDTQAGAGGATQTLASFVESPSAADGAAVGPPDGESPPASAQRTGISDAVFED